MANYAIGDVQGCFKTLHKLVKQIQFDPVSDRIWFVGDLVNRGPDSLAVLRYIKELGSAAVTVLGNHDLHLLAIWAGVAKAHRKDTLESVLSAPDCDELLTWLRHRSLIHQENGFLMVHAGLLPHWTATQAVRLAREVEAALQSESFVDVLPFIYYRHSQDSWGGELSYHDRIGVSTNVMTRLRVCSSRGIPELSFKGPPAEAPDDLIPWFDIPERATTGDTIIFGHWSALGLYVRDNLLGLDAGCVWGQEMVAICLEDCRVFHAACAEL